MFQVDYDEYSLGNLQGHENGKTSEKHTVTSNHNHNSTLSTVVDDKHSLVNLKEGQENRRFWQIEEKRILFTTNGKSLDYFSKV